MRSEPLDLEDTWREIDISLTQKLEKSKVRVVGTHDMRSHEMIWVIGSIGHVARDQHFMTHEMEKSKVSCPPNS
jgi:hypothetical protein